VRLSLDTREVGRVTVVSCNGRIVAGEESESLRSHVSWLLHDRRAIVLHLGDVVFIDSSGLGTIVRTLTSVRQAKGELKLCNVPDHVRKVLELSHLAKLFDAHESEEKAVAAFYTPKARAEAAAAKSRSVLCVDTNANVLAYLRELLRPGYDVHTSGHLRDALLLMRITNFDLLVVGPDIPASASAQQAFQTACSKLQVIELDKDFSTRAAAEAGTALLEQIQARLNGKNA
jgi:anti-sigma B factor antagonist